MLRWMVYVYLASLPAVWFFARLSKRSRRGLLLRMAVTSGVGVLLAIMTALGLPAPWVVVGLVGMGVMYRLGYGSLDLVTRAVGGSRDESADDDGGLSKQQQVCVQAAMIVVVLGMTAGYVWWRFS